MSVFLIIVQTNNQVELRSGRAALILRGGGVLRNVVYNAMFTGKVWARARQNYRSIRACGVSGGLAIGFDQEL